MRRWTTSSRTPPRRQAANRSRGKSTAAFGDVAPDVGKVQPLAAAGGLGELFQRGNATPRLLRQILRRVRQAHGGQRGLPHAGAATVARIVSLPERGISASSVSADDQFIAGFFVAAASPGEPTVW